METLFSLSWRVYPCTALMLLGALCLARGVRQGVSGLFRQRGPAQVVALMDAFRSTMLGVLLAGIGAAWLWGITWLFVLALVFGLEEIYESSRYLSLLRRPRKTADPS
jgi:hypothetical protein